MENKYHCSLFPLSRDDDYEAGIFSFKVEHTVQASNSI